MIAKIRPTIDDLYQLPEKAEIVNGEIEIMSPTGGDPGYAGDEIYVSLREYAKRTKKGRAVSDNKGFRVNLPNRASFSPDAAFYVDSADCRRLPPGTLPLVPNTAGILMASRIVRRIIENPKRCEEDGN